LAIPAAGTITSIQNISKKDIQEFLALHLKRENIVIAVNSALPESQIRQMLEKSFQALAVGGGTPANVVKKSGATGKRLLLVSRPGSATTEMAIGHFGIAAQRADREALEIGLFLFGGDMSSRLFQELRAKKGWTYGVFSTYQFLEIPRRHGGAFAIYAFPHAEHTANTLKKTLALYRDYVRQGITPKELAFAKSTMKNSYPFQFASSRAKLTGRLYEFLDGAPLLSVNEYRRYVDGITVTSLKKSIQSAHDSENIWVVMVGDPKALQEGKKSVKGWKEVVELSPDQIIP
jgi:zinc protease